MKALRPLLGPSIGFIVGLSLALGLTALAGENPFNILQILFRSAFGSNYDLGMTLSYVTPLIFTGLSVCIAFHAGLFNIGTEGQLTMAAITTTLVGVLGPQWPFPIAPLVAITAGLAMGACWGAFVGWLKVFRGSHEVINSIMMNFIAAGLSSWVALQWIPNPESQNPESAMIQPTYLTKEYDLISRLFPDTPVNASLVFAIILAVTMWIFLWKTHWGFELRAVGKNAEAAERAGISKTKWQMIAMSLAGLLAGFVSFSEVVGSTGQFRIGFSPEYGFIGIAVALAAHNNPLGIIVTAFLMGALHKGASDLDLETATITRDFSKIIQAFVIIGVTSSGAWLWMKSVLQKNKGDQ